MKKCPVCKKHYIDVGINADKSLRYVHLDKKLKLKTCTKPKINT